MGYSLKRLKLAAAAFSLRQYLSCIRAAWNESVAALFEFAGIYLSMTSGLNRIKLTLCEQSRDQVKSIHA